MGKFQQNTIESVVVDNLPDGGGNFKLCSACRRKIIDTMRCGGGGYRHRHTVHSPVAVKPKDDESKPECISDASKNKKSKKLSELLTMSELLEEEDEEVKKKVEALEELKRVVKLLRCGGNDDVLAGAKEVRRLAMDDSDARTTLALLGAIPPLIAMLDSDIGLYALLNLGIDNDT